MKDVIYREKGVLSDKCVAEFATLRKNQVWVDEPAFKEALSIKFCRYLVFLNDVNSEIANILAETKIKRDIIVITTNFDIVEILKEKVSAIYVIDSSVEYFPNLWIGPSSHYINAIKLKENNHMQMLSTIRVDAHWYELIVESNLELEVKYYRMQPMNLSDTVRKFKKYLKSMYQNNVKAFKDSTKTIQSLDNRNIKTERDVNRKYRNAKTIEDLVIVDKLLTKEQSIEANSYTGGYEKYLIDNEIISREQLLNYIGMLRNQRMLNKVRLENFVYKNLKLPKTISDLGVLELYKNSDKDFEDMYLAIPYTSPALVDTIKANVSCVQILLTLPEYIEEVKANEYTTSISN